MNTGAVDVNFQAPVKSVSIENMVRMRQAVMDRFEQAIALLQEAASMAVAAHIGNPRLEIATNGRGRTGTPVTAPDARTVIQREIDRVAWAYLMGESGLRTFMDAEARKKWDAQLYDGKDEIPELTPENVEATFGAMYAARGVMFERGVIHCFKRLSWDYKTNKPYHFGKRIILGHLFSVYPSKSGPMLYLRHEETNELDDLMRVFHVIDGKPEPDHRHAMYALISDAQHRREKTCENEYVSIKWFLKGSGHVLFKRPDLVDRLNAIISKHYPAVGHDERK